MAGLSSPDQRQFTGTDLLVHGRTKEVVDPRWYAPTEDPIIRAISLGNELAGVKATQGGGEVLASLERKKRSSFDLSRQTALRTRFGAGRAEVNTVGGIKLDTADLGTDKAIVEANSKSAERVIGQVSSVLNYTEILLESKKTGKSPDVILAERKIKGATWDGLRNAALDAMLDSDAVRELVPDLSTQLPSIIWQRDFIEAALASDPTLHSKIAEKMIAIEARTREFTGVTSDRDLAQTTAERESHKAQRDAAVDSVMTILDSQGIKTTDRAVIESMIASKQSPQVIVDTMLKDAISKNITPASVAAIKDYHMAQTGVLKLSQAVKKIARYDRLKNTWKANDPTNQAQVDDFDEQIKRFNADIVGFETTTDPALIADIAKYNRYATLFAGRDPASGAFGSEVGQMLQHATQSQEEVFKRDTLLRAKEGGSRSQRLAEESDVIADMESILSEAIGDVLSERLAEMKRLDAVAQQKRAEQLEETGNKDQAVAVKKVGGIMESKWSSLDIKDRKRIIHRDKIGSDVRRLAYEGQDGLRALIREDLVSGGIVMIDGKGVTVAKATPEEHKRIDELVDSVYQQEGHAYAKRLFADFVEARSIGNSRSKDFELTGTLKNLGLKDHEWDLLAKNFEGMIGPQGSNSPEGAQLMAQLQKEGIDIKGKGAGFLAMLLLLLGGAIAATASAVKRP